MGHRLLGGHRFHGRRLQRAERPARRRQDDAVHLVGVVEIEDLEYGAMFGIHRKQGGAAALDFGDHYLTRGNQAFLVGESDNGTALHGGQG